MSEYLMSEDLAKVLESAGLVFDLESVLGISITLVGRAPVQIHVDRLVEKFDSDQLEQKLETYVLTKAPEVKRG